MDFSPALFCSRVKQSPNTPTSDTLHWRSSLWTAVSRGYRPILPRGRSMFTVVCQSPAARQYAPTLQPCPSGTTLVREVGSDPFAQTLNDEESHYISARRSRILPKAWAAYLDNVKRSVQLPFPPYVDSVLLGLLGVDTLPNVGIATSGGGLRAALFGAALLNALDGRNKTSVAEGMGGLLQATSYISGLSGGAWLVLSLAQADFPAPLPDLVFGTSLASGSGDNRFGGWITNIDILQPGPDADSTDVFRDLLVDETRYKWAAGFPVTVADAWGRSLARHFVNGTTADDFFDANLTHGAGITLSSVADVSTFRGWEQPFPIVIADSVNDRPNTSVIINETGVVVPLGNPIYEFTVYETGSFDPALGAFTPTKFLGSPNSSVCTTGFDQISFVQAASSSLFNTFNISNEVLLSTNVGPIISRIMETMPQPGVRLDSAQLPNPFHGVSPDSFVDSNSTLLTLVDGGEDAETTPFQPLLVKARGVDTIIAIDAPADTDDDFTDGSSLIATQERVKLLNKAYSFPPVPTTQAEFLVQNLTKRPTFFGCHSPPSTGDPLVIYIANGGPPLGQAPVTNISTAKLSYTPEEAQALLSQVHDIATQGIPVIGEDGTMEKDPEWPACLACAVVDRTRRRLGFAREGVCVGCFERYCWS
ncbi:lysophospholipase [Trametes cingulata]|nr:lysophospholipase [Trametes cingulata]